MSRVTRKRLAGGGSAPIASTFRQAATLSLLAAYQGRVRCILVTAHARPDGADIRVYRDALTLAHMVGAVTPDPAGYAYELSWIDNLPAGNATYRIEYGSQGALPLASYTQAELTTLLRAFTTKNVGENLAQLDSSYVYRPADFAGAGVQLFGQRDDNGGPVVLDGQPVIWNGVQYGAIYHSSNGTVQFSASAVSGDRAGAATLTDGLAWGANDLYESYRRQVLLPDGLAWHILTGGSGYTADIKIAVRYYRPTGVWTLTVLNWTNGTATRSLSVFAGGQRLDFPVPPVITETDPTQAMTLVVLPYAQTASAAGESAI